MLTAVRTSFLLAMTITAASPVLAQRTRWVIEPRGSLAWWQINPHFSHLWATTCPADPSWQPGEGHSPGQYLDFSTRRQTLAAAREDDRIPLYPRGAVRLLCRQAVRGVFTADDTVSWGDLRGDLAIAVDSLVTGLDLRDEYAKRAVFETAQYPEIRVTLDSVTAIQPGDTITARAHGTLHLRGQAQPLTAPLTAWRESGLLRVQTRFSFPSRDLIEVYDMSRWALGLGVTMAAWKTVHAGVDVVLRQVPLE